MHLRTRVRMSMRRTMSLTKGLSDHVLSVEEFVAMLPEPVTKKSGTTNLIQNNEVA